LEERVGIEPTHKGFAHLQVEDPHIVAQTRGPRRMRPRPLAIPILLALDEATKYKQALKAFASTLTRTRFR